MKPMLAATIDDLKDVRLPVIGTPKYDGCRAVVVNKVVLSRTFLPIPSLDVQKRFGGMEGFDGELLVGDPTDPMSFNSSGGISKVDGVGASFHTFDCFLTPSLPYEVRAQDTAAERTLLRTVAEIEEYEDKHVQAGWEGVILRDPKGKYKYGRSTMTEQGLMKYKRWYDSEALVIGYEPLMRNDNPLTKNGIGHAKRATVAANKVPQPLVGSLSCIWNDKPLSIGMFGTMENCAYWWEHREELIGKRVMFKYTKAPMKMDGTPGKPRFPQGIRFREDCEG